MIIVFKIFLILAVLGLCYLVLFRSASLLGQRILGVLLAAALCLFIIVPEWSTRVANAVGIGRGTDLSFYLGHVTAFYLLVILYRRLQRTQDQLTQLVRKLSQEKASPPNPTRTSAP